MSAERFGRPQGRRAPRIALALAGLLGLGCLFAAGAAHAQAYYCNGAGPGEAVVGMSQGGNGIASMPLCQRVDNGNAQQAPQGYMPQVPLPDTFMAVIIHPDTSRFWTTAGYGSNEAATQDALRACTQTMGEGCEVAAAWSNFSQIAVVEDAAGNLFVEGATSRSGKAEKNAHKTCEKYSTGCRTLAVVDNEVIPKQAFPAGPLPRRPFAAIARPKGTPPAKWDDTAWLSSGQSGFKATEDAVLSQCRHDTGMDCELRVSVGNGKIARIADDAGHLQWLNISNPDALAKQVRASCPKDHECRIIDTFDAHTTRTATFEISKSDAPARGFFSLARPIDEAVEKTWSRRALATGRDSREAAQKAAVELCQAESKSPCEAVPKDGDRGTDQFFVLLRNGAGAARIFFGMSADDAQHAKEQSCAKENMNCPKGLTVDLAKPATTLLKI